MKNLSFSPLSPELVAERLTPPAGSVSAVLDSDTYNEIDDQFALAYAVLSESIDLAAVYAAPFHNKRSSGPEDGMEKSYEEIQRILEILTRRGATVPGTVLRGSRAFLPAPDTPVESDAARDIIERAHAGRNGVLYVVAIGAITNVASALLLDPSIREKIVVVWLGGHPYYWYTAVEFNLKQDLFASQLIFSCGVPLMHIPCKNVAEHLNTTGPELEHFLKGRNALCDYLVSIAKEHIQERGSISKIIWDISTIAWLCRPAWVPSYLHPAPLLTSDFTWGFSPSEKLVRVAYDLDRDAIFGDLFAKL
jgi:inosine-uridine nucleoside N-ribohydrolase